MTGAPRDTARHRPAHLSRTRHPTPWADDGTAARTTAHGAYGSADPTGTGRPDTRAEPVFVDDTGQRRRLVRLVGLGATLLIAGYLVVMGLTFVGMPLVDGFAPPGADDLARPAGGDEPEVGPGARTAPLPPAATTDPGDGPTDTSTGAPSSGDGTTGSGTSPTGPAPAPATTAPPPPTTTTSVPGRGATTSVPGPGSTAPDHTVPSPGGPPDPPGRP